MKYDKVYEVMFRAKTANRGKRYVYDMEKVIELGKKAGYTNIRHELSAAGNMCWFGDFGHCEGAMFACDRKLDYFPGEIREKVASGTFVF